MSEETRYAANGGRLDVVIVELWPEHSRAQAARIVRDGGVTVDGAVVTKPAAGVRRGASVTCEAPAPVPLDAEPQDLPVRIVYQDADLAVIDKDPGMVVHPGAGHADGTLVNALLHHLDDLSGIGGTVRPGIVHRLDRGTSGLLVVAKNDRTHACLAAQFADHSAGRTYLAICDGSPKEESGTIHTQLGRHPKHRVRFASVPEGKEAITHWAVEERFGALSAIRCRLDTGRTHQIRVHLTEAGWPLLGDPLYGRTRVPPVLRPLLPPERPMLHARELRLVHPDGRPLVFTAPVPPDMLAVLEALRNLHPSARAALASARAVKDTARSEDP